MLLLPDKKILILDIEGNSLSNKNELKITQFSALYFQNGSLEKEINFYNRNVNKIPMIVQKMTHLSLKNLKEEGLSERHLVKEIHDLLQKSDMIYAYGYAFDKQIVQNMFCKYHLPKLDLNWLDIQDIVKEQLNPEHLKLSVLSQELGFEKSNFHNALTDCYAIYHIIQYLDEKEKVAL